MLCPLAWLQPLRCSPHSLTHTVPFPLQGFVCYYSLEWCLVLTSSKHAGKRSQTFLCSVLVHLGLHINLPESELWLTQQFSFFGSWLGNSGHVCLTAIWQTSWGPVVGSCIVIEATGYSLSGCVIFGQDHLLCQWTCTTSPVVLYHSEWHVEYLSLSPLIYFCLPLPALHQL